MYINAFVVNAMFLCVNVLLLCLSILTHLTFGVVLHGLLSTLYCILLYVLENTSNT